MGGIPCEKVIINGRLNAELANIREESEIASRLLAAKGYYDSPALQELITFETGLYEELRKRRFIFRQFNDKYAAENQDKS